MQRITVFSEKLVKNYYFIKKAVEYNCWRQTLPYGKVVKSKYSLVIDVYIVRTLECNRVLFVLNHV